MTKCPICQSENPEGKRFCGDCGAALTQPQPIQAQLGIARPRNIGNRTLVVLAVLAVTVIVLFVSVLTYTLTRPDSPEEVFENWIVCLNNGDARGATDLTIFSRMGLESYLYELELLEAGVTALGTHKITLHYAVEVLREDEVSEDWFSGLAEAINMLDEEYGIVVKDYAGVRFSLTSYIYEDQVERDDVMPMFKVADSWYLTHRLWYQVL